MKNSRHGKAAIVSDRDCDRIRRALRSEHHRLIFDIARWTGERWGAILQLQVSDVYRDASRAVPHKEVTFQARTRKASPSGVRRTRQLPINQALDDALRAYRPPTAGYLFPGDGGQHLSWSAADKALRSAIHRAGLDHKGISTHSTRRTFITKLWAGGTDLRTLQSVTGHADLKVLSGYIEVSADRVKAAIALA